MILLSSIAISPHPHHPHHSIAPPLAYLHHQPVAYIPLFQDTQQHTYRVIVVSVVCGDINEANHRQKSTLL
jgi:hypothetical protein